MKFGNATAPGPAARVLVTVTVARSRFKLGESSVLGIASRGLFPRVRDSESDFAK